MNSIRAGGLGLVDYQLRVAVYLAKQKGVRRPDGGDGIPVAPDPTFVPGVYALRLAALNIGKHFGRERVRAHVWERKQVCRVVAGGVSLPVVCIEYQAG